MPYVVEREPVPGESVITVRFDEISSGWEQWVLLRSDAHHDSFYCNEAMERKHLDEAKERGALIFDIGDVFDAMQGKWDKRGDKSALREELRVDDYFDAAVRFCADFYEPYAERWVMMSPGNHESMVLKRNEIDLTQRLIATLNDRTGSRIHVGTYSGWVRFLFTVNGTQRTSRTLRYTHGYGGGGPVTLDVIQHARQAVYIDADVLWSGHTHTEWEVTRVRQRLSPSGRIVASDMLFLKTPGYKDGWKKGSGFDHERLGAGGPRPSGARWLRFSYDASRSSRDVGGPIAMETLKAK